MFGFLLSSHIPIFETRLKKMKPQILKDRRYIGDKVMRTFKERLRHVFGSCPKRNTCNLHQNKSETCIYGPYQYCGKYRATTKSKKHRRCQISLN
jgi:hypothetical protein